MKILFTPLIALLLGSCAGSHSLSATADATHRLTRLPDHCHAQREWTGASISGAAVTLMPIETKAPMNGRMALEIMDLMQVRPATCAELDSYSDTLSRSVTSPIIALDLGRHPAWPGKMDSTNAAALVPDGRGKNTMMVISGRGTWPTGVYFLVALLPKT